jgi:hypothetical protein
MKKVSIILMMIGFVLPSWAQLGFRTLWEKPFGSVLYSELVSGPRPYSQRTPNGNVLFSHTYRQCASKCSTGVVIRVLSLDSTYKTQVRYQIPNGGQYIPAINGNSNGYFLKTDDYYDDKGVFNYLTSIYDPNFELKATLKNWNSRDINVISPNSDRGFFVTVRGIAINTPDTLLRFNGQGQPLWKYPLQAFYRKQSTDYNYTHSELPFHWKGESAYISKKEVRDDTFSNIIISSEKSLVLVDSTGKEKWTTQLDTDNSTLQMVGVDAQAQWVLFTKKDTTSRLLKYNEKGVKTAEFNVQYTGGSLSGLTFQNLPDNGFLLYNKDYPSNITKFDASGKKEWVSSGIYYIDKVKVYPNGNIFVNAYFVDNDHLFIYSSKGNTLLSESFINMAEAANGGLYLTTQEQLYAITPTGEIGWSIKRPNSHANVSLDSDGGLLLAETIETKKGSGIGFLQLVGLDITTAHKISKFSKEGKLLWQLPIAIPVKDSIRQVKFLGGIYPTQDGNYMLVQLMTTLGPNANVGRLDNFSQVSSLLKITPPCYQKVEATLKASTTTLCTGQKLQLSSNTDSLNLLSYQWQRDGQLLSTTRTPAFEATGAGAYRVTVRDSVCGTSFVSNTINVISRQVQLPAITSSGTTDFCAGSDFATVTAVSPNQELRYQWLRNGQALSGTFQNSLKVTEGGSYQLAALDPVCGATVLSNEIIVKVRPLPDAVVTPEISGAVYAPFKAKLRANEGAGLTYQWLKEGVELAGATSSVYEAGESGNYAVRVSREGCSQLSQTVVITILQPLGVETVGTEEFRVFPNPNRGDFEISLPTGWEKADIELVDVIGRSLPMNRMGNQLRVEAVSGIYWLRVKLAEKELSKRVVIAPF